MASSAANSERLLPAGGSRRLRVAMVENAIPTYRLSFYERLAASDLELTVFCQTELPETSVQLVHEQVARLGIQIVRLRKIGSEHKLAWQFLPIWRLARDFDVIVFYGNTRYLSTVWWSTVLRACGKRIVLRNQVRSAGGGRLWEALRLRWWSRFRDLIVYTDREAEYLRRRGFDRHRITGWNNGLDQRRIDMVAGSWTKDRLEAWQHEQRLTGRVCLLSSARLLPKNQYELVVRALPQLVESHPNLLWCVIGDGPERKRLEQLVAELQLGEFVRFVGALYDEEGLAPWFRTSVCFVHPGAIGLSLLHAFGYGLPVVTHDNADQHMPEFAAFENERCGLTFPQGSVQQFGVAIRTLLEDPVRRDRMRAHVLRVAREQYNVDVMAERFQQAVTAAAS